MPHPVPRRALVLAACLAGAAVFAPSARATWSIDPTVNNPVEANGTTSYLAPGHYVCTDGAGGFFVGWNGYVIPTLVHVGVQHVLADGTLAPGWPANGLAVTSVASKQTRIQIAPDGTGGVLVAWADDRNGNTDVYAQRITGNGTLLWADGVPVGASAKPEYPTGVASDGAGGMLVVWSLAYGAGDDDVVASHVLAAGVVDPAVNLAGFTVAGTLAEELNPVIAPDNAGGCWIAWQDHRNGVDYDIYVDRFTSTFTPAAGWSYAGLNLIPGYSGANQTNPMITVDGAGGAYVAWSDYRAGVNPDIYVNHVTPDHPAVAPWGNGSAVVADPAIQDLVNICPDSTGGLFVMWDDYRFSASSSYPFAQHLRNDGSRAPGWSANGNLLSNLPGLATYGAPDGVGGLLAAWTESYSGGYDLMGMRLLADGTQSGGWAGNGQPVSTATDAQVRAALLPDGTGGAFVTWWDVRSGTAFNHYAERIDGCGALGDATPAIVSVNDLKPDQGGKVLLVWSRSYLDASPRRGIGSYWIWRQVPGALAQQAMHAGAALAGATDDASALATTGRRVFASARGNRAAGTGYAWEFVVSQPANGGAAYSYVASTLVDSSASANPLTSFMVEAHATSSTAFWPSAPAAGYSVDNLAPATPTPFLGTYAGGTTSMSWGNNREPDFADYRLYRGVSAAFAPGQGNLVATLATTAYADHAGGPYFYKLGAVDIHGNESAPALLLPTGTTGVDQAAPVALALAIASANPARAGATLRFDVPAATHVRLAIYDPQGRRVRSLVDAPYGAGRYSARWDGLDGAGANVTDGLYFVRLEADGLSLRAKLVTCH